MQARTDSARVARMIERNGDALLRVAKRYSLCADDAHDAVQRGLEIYLRRLDRIEPATELAWLKVVVKHEALAVRRSRSESVSGEEVDFDAREAEIRSIPERYEAVERSGRSAEALRRLKADEATALMLKAEGLSYQEIGRRFGWTYTKVNRCITEGRRRFLRVYADLEAGDTCEEHEPALAALVEGRATSRDLVELRPHLRHCGACRATVRELHQARRPRAAALLPLPTLLAPVRWLHVLAQRAAGSDIATTVQLASGAGGGRSAGVAALVGLCLAGGGPACLTDEPPAPRVAAAPVKPERPRPKTAPPNAVTVRPAGAPRARIVAPAAQAPATSRRVARRTQAAPTKDAAPKPPAELTRAARRSDARAGSREFAGGDGGTSAASREFAGGDGGGSAASREFAPAAGGGSAASREFVGSDDGTAQSRELAGDGGGSAGRGTTSREFARAANTVDQSTGAATASREFAGAGSEFGR